jgi:hypothetical protein
MPDETLRVEGMTGMLRAFNRIDKRLAKDVKKQLALAAVPVQLGAQQRAVTQISGLRRENPMGTAKWAFMRIGVTSKVVYVAPQQRGRQSRRNTRLKRPNMAGLLLERAMLPALRANTSQVVARLDRVLGELGLDWER